MNTHQECRSWHHWTAYQPSYKDTGLVEDLCHQVIQFLTLIDETWLFLSAKAADWINVLFTRPKAGKDAKG